MSGCSVQLADDEETLEERQLLAGVPGPAPAVWRRIEATLRQEGVIR